MDKLIRTTIQNKSLTFFTVALIAIFGMVSFLSLPQNEDPPIQIRTVQILTFWEGATPEDIELYISKPIETAVVKQEYVSKVYSKAIPGVSIVNVDISDYVSSEKVKAAFQDIRNYVNDTRGNLPQEIVGPIVNDRFGETSAYVIGLVSRSGNLSYRQLESLAERIKDRVKTVKGVGDFDFYGTQKEKIYIDLSKSHFESMDIAPSQIIQAVRTQNIQLAQPHVRLSGKKILLEVTGPYRSVNQIRNTIVYTDPEGRVYRIKDLESDIHLGYEDPPKLITRVNQQKSVILAISMKRGYNIVHWGKRVAKVLGDIEKDLPGDVDMVILSDQPTGVEEAVNGFMENFYEAIILVLLVIGVGMGLNGAAVVAIAIPLIMLLTFAAMGLLNIELHQMSINALIISLGMVVDNAIVITDNVSRYIKQGYDKSKAAFLGAREVKIALFSGTLTTIAAFFPLALMPGDVGAYIVDLPRVITIALLASYLVAMFVSPVSASLFLPSVEKLKEKEAKKKKKKKKKKSFSVEKIYFALIEFTHRFKWLTITALLLLFAGSFFVAINYIPLAFFPPADKEQFIVNVWLPHSWNLRATSAITGQLEKELEKMRKITLSEPLRPFDVISNMIAGEKREEKPLVTSYVSYIGAGGPRFYITISPQPAQSRYAQIMVNTSSSKHTNKTVEQLRDFVDRKITGAQVDILKLETGPPVEAPIQVKIAGDEIDELKKLGAQVRDILANTNGVTGENNDYGVDSPKFVINIDQEKARMLGLTSEDIASGIYVGFEGYPISRLKAPERQIDIMLRLQQKERKSIADIKSMIFTSSTTHKKYRLDDFATISLDTYTSAIIRRNQRRTLTVNAYVDDREPSEVLAEVKPKIAKIDLPRGYEISYGGQDEASNQAFGDLASLAFFALLIILLILAYQFKSIKIALSIYLSIPLAFIGAVAGMYIMKQSLGFMSALGLISLAGIVVNNAIIMIEFIQDNLREGKELLESIKLAGIVRLRPIMLTTVSTIGGLLPLAFFGGALFEPMCWVIIFGLSLSTILTLLVIPLFYVILGGAKDSMRIIEDEKETA